MTIPRYFCVLALMIAGCSDPESTRRLDAEIESLTDRIAQTQEEIKSFAKGTVPHDLVALRIAIYEQTVALLEQRRAAARWRTSLSYTVDGKPYAAPADVVARVAAIQTQLRNAREGRESDLQLMRGSADSARPQYVASIATKTLQIAQLEYQLAAYANAFPPYYVQFSLPPKPAAAPPVSEAPAKKPVGAK